MSEKPEKNETKPPIKDARIVTCPYCEMPIMRVGTWITKGLAIAVAACDFCKIYGEARATINSPEAIRTDTDAIARELNRMAYRAAEKEGREMWEKHDRLGNRRAAWRKKLAQAKEILREQQH